MKIMQPIDLINQANNAYNISNKTPALIVNNTGQDDNQMAIFANMVKNTFDKSFDKVKQADNISLQALQGKADVASVILAFAEAEEKISEAVAIKQVVLTAINDILKLSF